MKAVPPLFIQLEALSLLLCDNEPDLRIIQGTVYIYVLYIFGYASGSGFGALWTDEYVVGFIFGV